jgi:hypothetical protein
MKFLVPLPDKTAARPYFADACQPHYKFQIFLPFGEAIAHIQEIAIK